MSNFSKIFGIGQPKTATSSLGSAFDLLGYSHKSWDERLWRAYREADYETVFREADRFQTFEDLPWCEFDFYKMLDRRYPESKFILTIRDPEQYMRSYLNFKTTYQKESVPYPEAVLRRYSKHNREVKEYFKDRPDDLLVLDICAGDGWDKLCPFMGVRPPKEPFPFINKGAYPSTER